MGIFLLVVVNLILLCHIIHLVTWHFQVAVFYGLNQWPWQHANRKTHNTVNDLLYEDRRSKLIEWESSLATEFPAATLAFYQHNKRKVCRKLPHWNSVGRGDRSRREAGRRVFRSRQPR
jgi:hypothetical protein